MRFVKWLLVAVAGLVLLLLALYAGLTAFTDASAFKIQIAQAVHEATGLDTSFEGGIELKLFPRLGVKLGKTVVGTQDGFGKAPLASLESAEVEVEVWPLLREKRLVAHTVRVAGLHATLVRHADGRANWDPLVPKKVTVEKEQVIVETKQGQNVAFNYEIEGFELTDSQIQYSDAATGQTMRVSSMDLRTGSVKPLKPVDVKGAGSVELGIPVVKGQLEFGGQVTFDPDAKTLDFAKASFKSQVTTEKLPLRASSQTLTGAFHFSPDSGMSAKDVVVASSSKFVGLPVDEVETNFRGNLQVSAAGVFDLPPASMDLKIKSAGRTLATKARFAGHFDPGANTAALTGLDLGMAGLALTGELRAAMAGDVPRLDGRFSLRSDNLRAALTEAGVTLPQLPARSLGKFAGEVKVSGSAEAINVKVEHFALDAITGSANLTAKAKAQPQLAFDVNLDTLDLPAYLPAGGSAAPAAPAAAQPAKNGKSAQAELQKTLRELSLAGSFRVQTLIVPKLSLSQVSGKLTARDGILELSPFTCQLASGSVKASVRTDARNPRLEHKINFEASDLQVGHLARTLAHKDMVDGRLSAGANVSAVGDDAAEIERSLTGSARFRLTGGVVRGGSLATDIFTSVEKLMGAVANMGQGSAKTEIQNAQASFAINQGVAATKDLVVQSNPHKITGTGSIDIPKQTMDFRLDALIAGLGSIPVGVSGPMDDPKVNVDPSALAKAAVRGVTSTVGNVLTAPLDAPKILQDTGKGLLEGVGRLLGPGSPQKK